MHSIKFWLVYHPLAILILTKIIVISLSQDFLAKKVGGEKNYTEGSDFHELD